MHRMHESVTVSVKYLILPFGGRAQLLGSWDKCKLCTDYGYRNQGYLREQIRRSAFNNGTALHAQLSRMYTNTRLEYRNI